MDAGKATAAAAGGSVLFLPQNSNLGYAAATNRGVAASSGEFVLLLNPDAVLERDAISALLDAAARRPQAIGFAPKVFLQSHEWILDSVGIDLLLRAEGAQRGLGEPDIGQYDLEERVAGLCFAAALVRRSAFSPGSVGSLDERYFMFYEDVDWSIRAAARGEEFWSVPSARVQHVHSASARQMRSGFKDRLIQRNLIWTAAKNLERRRVGKVVVRQTMLNLLGGVLSGHPWASLRVTAEAWAGMPRMMGSRRECQKRRRRSDREVLSKSPAARSFDAASYRPLPSVATLVSVLSRLYVSTPNPILGALVLRLTLAAETSTAVDTRRMAQLVRDSGVDIPPGLEWLLNRLETE
jgi:GT2 family glycosyltransferase